MHLIQRDRKFLEETNAANVLKYFPYYEEQLEGVKILRDLEHDVALMSNHGRLFAKGQNLRRLGHIPIPVLLHAKAIYGPDFLLNSKKLHMFFKHNPEWSYIHKR